MTAGRIEMHLHAALRKHITDDLEPETAGQHDLITSCKELRMGRSNISTTVWVDNDSLGAALDICREWLHCDNGAKLQAAKATLTRHELEYAPNDPSERRYEVKLPASLGGGIPDQYWTIKDPEILADLKGCNWYSASTGGRVRAAALGWLLNWAESATRQDASAPQRAGKKFLATYSPVHAEALRQIEEFKAGRVEEKSEDSAAEELHVDGWESAELGDLLRPDAPAELRFVYGGQHGGALSAPTAGIPARLHCDGAYSYAISDLETGQQLVSGMPMRAEIWYRPAEDIEDQDHAAGGSPEVPSQHWEPVTVTSVSGRSYIYYGGLAKGPCDESGPLVFVRWLPGSGGRNELVDVDGGEILATVHSNSRIWAARAVEAAPTSEDVEGDQAPEELAEDEQPEPEPEAGEVEWRNTELRELPYRLRGQRAQIIYGGRAGRRNPEPTARVWAGITYTGEGRYDICDLGTGDVLATVMLDSRIWWAPLPLEKLEGPVVAKDQGPEESREETPLPARPRGPIPENFLYMAENANTPDARAWWARKVAAWGQQ